MSHNRRLIAATSAQVRQALADGWSYADWVVGAVHVRGVDENWPQPGGKVYHKVGIWPLTLADHTDSTHWDPEGGELRLAAKMRPLGQVRVVIRWQAAGAEQCRVEIEEQFEHGPLLVWRNKVGDVLLHTRNNECLRRLADLVRRYPA